MSLLLVAMLCDLCQIIPAEGFCCCTLRLNRYCNGCFEKHQPTAGFHHLFALEVHSSEDIVMRVDFAQKKLLDLHNAQNAVDMILQKASSCSADVNAAAQVLIETISHLRDEALQRIRTSIEHTRQLLEATLSNLRNHAINPSYVPQSVFEHRIWHYSLGAEAEGLAPVSFNYAQQLLSLQSLLVLDFDEAPLVSHKLAIFDPAEFRIFTVSSESWGEPIHMTRSLPAVDYFCTFLPNGDLFHCGGSDGRQAHSSAFEVAVRSGDVRELQTMQSVRQGHGGASTGLCVFVFGGTHANQRLPTAEKFSLQDKAWLTLPSMRVSRTSFTPLLYKSRIYLCGGFDTLCEVFDLETNAYEVLPFTLAEKSVSMTVAMSEKEILILTAQNCHLFNVSSGSVTSSKTDHIGGWLTSTMCPVLARGVLYKPGWKGVAFLKLSTWDLGDNLP